MKVTDLKSNRRKKKFFRIKKLSKTNFCNVIVFNGDGKLTLARRTQPGNGSTLALARDGTIGRMEVEENDQWKTRTEGRGFYAGKIEVQPEAYTTQVKEEDRQWKKKKRKAEEERKEGKKEENHGGSCTILMEAIKKEER
jgi:ABC-type uncharacterized transport system ATPase component